MSICTNADIFPHKQRAVDIPLVEALQYINWEIIDCEENDYILSGKNHRKILSKIL